MIRTRLIMLLLAVGLTIFLFTLPRVVVDNSDGSMTGSDESRIPDSVHDQELSSIDQELIKSLKATVLAEESQEILSTFADSLAQIYVDNQMYDSAGKYFEKAANTLPNVEAWEKAGDAYYEAYTFAFDENLMKSYGDKARSFYQNILNQDSTRLDLETRIGMILVSSSTPMAGILKLRSVIEKDPTNEDALYNLGILAFQTGQYERALERFQVIMESNQQNPEVYFYAGLCEKELGNRQKAREYLTKVLQLDPSEEVNATVSTHLEELGGNELN